MSGTTPDDRELERLLSETAGVQRRYRESSLDEPSAQLDEAIRAAARREVSARPRLAGSPFSGSWRIPLSIAAVVLVSATVTLMVADREVHLPGAGDTARPVPAPQLKGARERDEPASQPPMSTAKVARPSAASETPKEKGAAVLSDTAVGAESEKREQFAASESQTAGAKTEAKNKAASPATAVRPEPFPAPAKLAAPPPTPAESPDQNVVRGDLPLRQSPADVVQPAAIPPPSRDTLSRAEVPQAAPAAGAGAKAKDEAAPHDARAPPAVSSQELRARRFSEAAAPATPATEESASAGALEKKQTVSADSDSGRSANPWEQDPRAWLKHVEELRAGGRIEDAKASFKAFRSRYPDYPLPAGFLVPGS